MDDNIWEYPFGDLDDDEDIFYRPPKNTAGRTQIPLMFPPGSANQLG